MSRAPSLRGALWIAILGSAVHSGCIHNHYYGTAARLDGCPPVGSTASTQVGEICEVPNGQVIVSNPSTQSISSNVTPPSSSGRSATMSAAGQSRIMISQPAYGPPSIGQSTSRYKWRKPDPESPPTLNAEGGWSNTITR